MDTLAVVANVGDRPRVPRVERLLSSMSTAEKVGQMTQSPLFQSHSEPSEFERVLSDVRAGKVGSFLNVRDLEQRNHLQRAAVEHSRLGIPLLFGRDVIHGYKTVFPIPLGLAASFDPLLAEAVAQAAAAEAVEAGIDWTFAPMVDVTREPRWGRVAEGFGEDPLLVSRFGAAKVRGFQREKLAACAKHYLGSGGAEAGKEYNTTWLPEPLIRDVYLPPFKACVEAGALTVMCGFNDLNGTPLSGNRWALRQLLKEELGFGGFVVSDWASMQEMIAHGLCADERQAARTAAHAGVDMEMASKVYQHELEQLVESGECSEPELNDAVRRILTVKFELGLFDQPYRDEPRESVTLSLAHRDLARAAARASFVLLENQPGGLPLPPAPRSLALVGPLADDPHNQLGCWSFDGDRSASVTLLAALQARLSPSTRLRYERGLPSARSEDRSGFRAALEAVNEAEVAVVVVGEDANISGECRSRAFLGLPGAQCALLEQLGQSNTPLILVVMAGRPLILGPESERARAILYAWHPGTEAGPALVEVLFGDAPPMGKLPMSFPRAVGQVPIYYNYKNTGRPPRSAFRGIPLGTPLDPVDMDASYLDVDVSPRYPFGFGRSYTTFEYSEVRVEPARGGLATRFEVSAKVTNTGARAGVEVAQLYVRDRVGSVTRPVRELKGFERIPLEPGASARVAFKLSPRDLEFCGRDLRVAAEPGVFVAYVGGDSTASASTEFELLGGFY